jgi:hypothetical protein
MCVYYDFKTENGWFFNIIVLSTHEVFHFIWNASLRRLNYLRWQSIKELKVRRIRTGDCRISLWYPVIGHHQFSYVCLLYMYTKLTMYYQYIFRTLLFTIRIAYTVSNAKCFVLAYNLYRILVLCELSLFMYLEKGLYRCSELLVQYVSVRYMIRT